MEVWILIDNDYIGLANQINEYLSKQQQNKHFELHDIKYTTISENLNVLYSALIIYRI